MSGPKDNPGNRGSAESGKKNKSPMEEALNFLKHRMRTVSEMRERLKDRGYDPEEIKDTIQELKQLRYLDDVEYAANAGYVIKLIASVKRLEDGSLSAIVCPRLVPKSNMLASVDDVYNAVSVTGDGVGDVLFYGQGAGKLPTASAVVGDIIDCLRHNGRSLGIHWEESKKDEKFVVRYKDINCSMYVRLKGEDVQALKPSISEMFGKLMYIERKNRPDDELAFITPNMVESDIDANLEVLSKSASIASKIRMF